MLRALIRWGNNRATSSDRSGLQALGKSIFGKEQKRFLNIHEYQVCGLSYSRVDEFVHRCSVFLCVCVCLCV